MWSLFIISHGHEELIDLDTSKKFNEAKNWVGFDQHRVNCEFFKHLGAMIKDELKDLAKHLLGKSEKCTEVYLKVTVEKIHSVKVNTYSTRD